MANEKKEEPTLSELIDLVKGEIGQTDSYYRSLFTLHDLQVILLFLEMEKEHAAGE